MNEVKFLAAARIDYREALRWYMARSQRTAKRFEAAVARALKQIQQAPERWTRIDDDDDRRFFVVRGFPFYIVYRNDPDAVLIISVAHESRSDDYWKDRG